MDNVNEKISQIFNLSLDYTQKFNNLMTDFKNEATQLVADSSDLYQVEPSIKLNKISLKDYILNSDFCLMLKENNINNYSIAELEKYMQNYATKNNPSEVNRYMLALGLYKKLEQLEAIEANKVNMETTELESIITNISDIKVIPKEEYDNLLNNINLEIKDKYLNTHLIDATSNSYLNQMLKDIFNYYKNI